MTSLLRLTDLLEPIIDLLTNPSVMETPLITKSTLAEWMDSTDVCGPHIRCVQAPC